MKNEKNGISLIVLVITIIVMIILASSVILSLSSSGLINKANLVQESTEMANEKQIIQIASANAMMLNNEAKLTVEDLQAAMDKYVAQDAVMVINNGGTIAVKFNETNRWYDVDTTGKILGTIEVELDKEGGVLDGTGTQVDPFVIMSIDDLIYFAKNVNTYNNKYVAIGTTLDFNSDLSYVNKNTTEYDEFLGGDGTKGLKEQLTQGLGFKPMSYTGTFDGRNNEIKNLKVEVEGNAGLFASASGTIKNINVYGYIISKNNVAGGIIGYNWGKAYIENCSFSGTVKSLMKSVGGIIGDIGEAITNIYNCSTKGEVISEVSSAGGIVGKTSHVTTLRIDGCVNNAKVYGGADGSGGCIGFASQENIKIKNSSNFGEVTLLRGPSHDGVGGIAGRGDAVIENCYNTGILKSVYAVDGFFRGAGGILGNGKSTINNSVYYGKIAIEGTKQNIGGIIGIANDVTIETIKLNKCYFNSDEVSKGIGKSAIVDEIAIAKNTSQLKSAQFVNELNSNIENGCPYEVEKEDGTVATETIDTTGWAKWVYNSGSYPTLDLTTKWSGTEWITEK